MHVESIGKLEAKMSFISTATKNPLWINSMSQQIEKAGQVLMYKQVRLWEAFLAAAF